MPSAVSRADAKIMSWHDISASPGPIRPDRWPKCDLEESMRSALGVHRLPRALTYRRFSSRVSCVKPTRADLHGGDWPSRRTSAGECLRRPMTAGEISWKEGVELQERVRPDRRGEMSLIEEKAASTTIISSSPFAHRAPTPGER